jgi:hypothetical protein
MGIFAGHFLLRDIRRKGIANLRNPVVHKLDDDLSRVLLNCKTSPTLTHKKMQVFTGNAPIKSDKWIQNPIKSDQ